MLTLETFIAFCQLSLGFTVLYVLSKSCKWIPKNKISAIEYRNGAREILQPGFYFHWYPFNRFSANFDNYLTYIDFGFVKRIVLDEYQIVYSEKNGKPAIHKGRSILIFGSEVTCNKADIRPMLSELIIYPKLATVFIHEGNFAYKIDKKGDVIFLDPGWHVINTYEGEHFDTKNIHPVDSNEYSTGKFIITHVLKEEEVLVKQYGEPFRLPMGRHCIEKANYLGRIPYTLAAPFIRGDLTVVDVEDLEVAVVQKSKKMVQCGPGRHYFLAPKQKFIKVISLIPRKIIFKEIVVKTSDNIPVALSGTISYEIVDVLKFKEWNEKKLNDYLYDDFMQKVNNVFLKFSAKSFLPGQEKEGKSYANNILALQVECRDKLHDNTLNRCGVRVNVVFFKTEVQDREYINDFRQLKKTKLGAKIEIIKAITDAQIEKLKLTRTGNKAFFFPEKNCSRQLDALLLEKPNSLRQI